MAQLALRPPNTKRRIGRLLSTTSVTLNFPFRSAIPSKPPRSRPSNELSWGGRVLSERASVSGIPPQTECCCAVATCERLDKAPTRTDAVTFMWRLTFALSERAPLLRASALERAVRLQDCYCHGNQPLGVRPVSATCVNNAIP